MAQKGDAGVLGGHAAAVVSHADIGGPAAAQLHGDVLGPGVKGVLHQLFDDGGGALHHLAGGDHVRHVGGEDIDNCHKNTSFVNRSIIQESG